MSYKRRILILGAGCHGKVLLDAVLEANCYEVVGLLDDNPARLGQKVLGVPIVGNSCTLETAAERFGVSGVVLAIGDNYVRSEKLALVRNSGLAPIRVIHPRAHVSRFAEIGEAVVILAGAVINAGATLEDNVCVNTAATVDHDDHLHRHCHIYPGATLAGTVSVGEFSYIGSGATVIPNLTIGAHSFIGAGAVVIHNVPGGITVAGVPARQICARHIRHVDSF